MRIARTRIAASGRLVQPRVQVQPLVEPPAVHGGGLDDEALHEAPVHEREQLVHVRVVRPRREHLAQRLHVPRAAHRVAVRHEPYARTHTIIYSISF